MTNARFFVFRTVLLALLCVVFGVIPSFSQRVFRAVLDGTQDTPPVTATTATGTGTVELNVAETSITVTMSFSGLSSNQTAAHIHGNAPRGAAAGVLFNVGSSGTTSGTFSFNQAVTPTDVANLKAGLWYFNVHSASFPGGEIRGQIEPDCANLPAGLVSWWQGEGNAIDQNAINNGTLENGAAFTTGRSGRAFLLDGVDDRVLLGNPAAMQVQDFTIEGWIKRSSPTIVTNNPFPGFDQGILFAYGSGGYGVAIDRVTNKLLLTQVGVSQILAPTLTITDTNFHHIAVTKSGGGITFYVDGVADTPIGYNPSFTFATNPAIGRRGDADSFNPFFGIIDELSVYSTPLTSPQIASIYAAGAAGKCPPCIATPVGLAEWWTGDGDLLGVRNRNNGGLFGPDGPTYAEGLSGHAFKFSGDSSFVVPDSSVLRVTTQFTFDAWINPSSLHSGLGSGGIISKIHSASGNNGYQFGLTSNNTEIYCQFNGVGEPWPTNQLIANVGSGIPLNAWSHVACTYDNNNLRIFLNGVQVGTLAVGPKTVASSNADLRISRDGNSNQQFFGLIDEPQVFSRALSATEIAALVNSGRSCFCKPTATTTPTGLVGWWGGDGDALDRSGNFNNGSLQNGTGFAVGKVGQSFQLNGANNFIQVPDTPSLELTTQMTLEAWIRPTDTTNYRQIMSRFGSSGNFAYQLGIEPNGKLRVDISPDGSTYGAFSSATDSVTVNQWNHVVATFNSGVVVLYINGTQAGTLNFGFPTIFSGGNAGLTIGRESNGIQYFVGLIDEASVYNRSLSATEVASIYNAGLAGKLKQASTVFNPIAENRPAKARNFGSSGPVIFVGDATIFFQGSSGIPGFTQWMPVPQSKLPPLPTQWQGLTYDISTTWQYTGISSVCFNVPSFTPAQFASLRLYHLEADNWVNRTNPSSMYPNLCTNALTSLSPFALANLVPNAAGVSVSGRVTTAAGHGLRGAVVTITDPDGAVRRAITSTFGYYRFDDIIAGSTYVIGVNSKRFTFAEPTRVVVVSDELADIDFVSQE